MPSVNLIPAERKDMKFNVCVSQLQVASPYKRPHLGPVVIFVSSKAVQIGGKDDERFLSFSTLPRRVGHHCHAARPPPRLNILAILEKTKKFIPIYYNFRVETTLQNKKVTEDKGE